MTHNRRNSRAERGLWRRAAALLTALCLLLPLCAAHAETVETVVEAPGQTVTVTGGLTNDEAAEGYINSILYPKARRPKSAGVYKNLTGKERKLYDALLPIVKDIAAGKVSNTEYLKIPVADVYEQLTYSAEQLGVSAILGEDNKMSTEVKAAMGEITYIDISAVFGALFDTCPYELYWFDKTVSHGYTNIAYSYNSTSITIVGYVDGCMTVNMPISEEYSTGSIYDFDTDKYNEGVVATAATNAQSIVDNASGSDYEKLVAYKQAICERVKYNDTAAGNSSTPYGNPWQLIWVFDGDANTNVVCEGYSKAFQYLCDLTTFNGNVSAICATGLLGSKGTSATGAGAHMWNIVTMEDGKNYLVDVTNCDGNSIGNPDYLFMKGYESCAQTTDLTQNDYERLERSGAVEKYSYNCGEDESVQAWYIYDAETLSAFGSTRLALSETAYDPNAAPTPVPTEYPKTLTLPNDTTSIKSMAFAYLGVPVNVCLPDNVTYIAPDAFEGSDVLLVYTAATPTADAVEKYLSDFAEKYPNTPLTPTLAYDNINYTP